MSFDYKAISLPDVWPGERTPQWKRGPSPFAANWGATLELLERETYKLNAKEITLALDVTMNDVRRDGGIRAEARIKDPAVILSFRSGANRLSFPCDRFDYWQDNVRAIALALEALRKVERYGIRAGSQYEGFKALPPSTSPTMSTESAAAMVLHGTVSARDILASPDVARTAIRTAKSRHHPDKGGDRTQWDNVEIAARVLSTHHGVSL